MSARKRRPPSYQHHQASGQARVRIQGRDHYLGPIGSTESQERYKDLVAQWRIREHRESFRESRYAGAQKAIILP